MRIGVDLDGVGYPFVNEAIDQLADQEEAASDIEGAGDPFPYIPPAKEPGGLNPKDRLGVKKAPLHLVPSAAIVQMSEAMANGAEKYGPFNWRGQPITASVYVSAALRHLTAWFDGEEVAEDSGVSHLAHAAAGLAILMDAIATGNVHDDRPPAGATARLLAEVAERRAA